MPQQQEHLLWHVVDKTLLLSKLATWKSRVSTHVQGAPAQSCPFLTQA